MKTISIIGTGNMGSALITAISKDKEVNLLLANRTKAKAEALADKIGGTVVSNQEAATADFVLLGVEPYQVEEVITEIKNNFKPSTVLVSMCAGKTIETLQKCADGAPVIRIMPNTPVSVGEGMVLCASSSNVKDEDFKFFEKVLKHAGRISVIDEKLINSASAITGCGPAFADMFVDALADGAVSCGIPRSQAIEFAAQMIVGAGKLILATNKHPDALKDEVCSPGGSTIEGVVSLENNNFRAAVISAVKASAEKSGKLG